MRHLLKPSALAAAFALLAPLPALAGPTLGIGVSFAFGGGTSVDTGAGLRIFSSDRRDRFAGTVGLDYMFTSRNIRPTLGLAYIGGQLYVGADVGFDALRAAPDIGASVGYVNSR